MVSFASEEPHKHFERATALIIEATPLEHHNAADIERINDILVEIIDLSGQLRIHEVQAKKYKRECQDLKKKKGFFWVFDVDARLQILQYDFKVHEEMRTVSGLKEAIDMHWAQLKPLYGVYSTMFFNDMFAFVPYLWMTITDVFRGILEMGLMAFIIGGPALLLMLIAFISLLGSFTTVIFLMPTVLAAFLWIFHLPWIIIQYDPTPQEFVLVYTPGVALLATIILIASKLFKKPAFIAVQEREFRRPHID